jgi:hypothetical protein
VESNWHYVVPLKTRLVDGKWDSYVDLRDQSLVVEVDLAVDGQPGWWVRAVFVATETDLTLISLSLSERGNSRKPPQTLTVEVLRSVRLEALYRKARSRVLKRTPGGPWFPVREEFHQHRRPGRKGRPDVEYADIARRYVGFLSTSSKPIEALAEDMSIGKSSASSYVHEARRRGLLTRTSQGTAGGLLTEKAIELLRSANVGEETR